MIIEGQVALITGGASGIGEAVGKFLAAQGAKVVLADMNLAAAEAVAASIREQGHHALAMQVNTADEASVVHMMDATVQAMGAINIVIAAAGIIRDSFLITPDRETGKVKRFMTTEQWQQVIDVNLTGVFLTLREAAIRMVNHGWKGVLIPISSINKSGELGQLNYASTKAAIALWPKILAGEFHARGINHIRVVAVAPGYVATPLLTAMKPEILDGIVKNIPIGRLVATDEISAAIATVITNEAFHGTTLEVAGGIVGSGLAK